MKRPVKAASGNKLTTKISKAKLEKARHTARYFGAEAVANDEGFNSYRDDVALRYGYETWSELPRDLKRDALAHYTEGRRIEKAGGSL
jgi:hypothetical protein